MYDQLKHIGNDSSQKLTDANESNSKRVDIEKQQHYKNLLEVAAVDMEHSRLTVICRQTNNRFDYSFR